MRVGHLDWKTSNKYNIVHPKQCRRLVKKKRKEVEEKAELEDEKEPKILGENLTEEEEDLKDEEEGSPVEEEEEIVTDKE